MSAKLQFLVAVLLASSALGAAEPSEQAKPARPRPPVYFEPPPMPEFMLRKPAAPLTHEEMARQAEEAAARVRKPKPATHNPHDNVK